VRRRPNPIGELLVVAFLLVVFDYIAGLADLRAGAAHAHGRDVLAVLPGGVERHANLWTAHHLTWLHDPESLYYDLAHINVTMIVLVVCWWARPSVYRQARNALLLINLIGLAVFYLYPVAPPRLLPGGGFVDIVARSGTWGASPDSVEHANAFGSMPSLHAAWAVWAALTIMVMTHRRWVVGLGWVHVALTLVITVITGNHYVVDLVAGAATTAVAWAVTSRAASTQSEVSQPVPRTSAGSGLV
jgi:hypothetical protein